MNFRNNFDYKLRACLSEYLIYKNHTHTAFFHVQFFNFPSVKDNGDPCCLQGPEVLWVCPFNIFNFSCLL
jgi:hypothetical protein